MTRLLRWGAGGAGLTLLALLAWIAVPPPAELLRRPADPTLRLLDRSGVPLRVSRSPDGALRQWVPIADLDPALLMAFVAAEDRRFFSHQGVDLLALGRAGVTSLRARRVVSGASTITMQLARLVRPLPRTLPGKLRQALWAIRLDAHYSKQEILEQYLNRVPLGQGAIGVEAAATRYFGGSARELSLGQAALLAGTAGAPSRDNPVANPQRASARRALVLARMQRLHALDAAEAALARLEPVGSAAGREVFSAPHFTAALLARVPAVRQSARGELWTTLDLALQAELEREVRHTVESMRSAAVRHAAVVVLDNASGGVLAWIGSPDFFEPRSGQVDMVTSPRQPGSTLKPFLYGLAFDRGYTAASILPDLATVYQTSTGPYAPRNYDRRFRGPVRAREALASSFNLPAVELAHRLGPAELLLVLQRAGMASLTGDAVHYGLGLALGNGDLSLLELANAYRALANGGVWHPVRMLAPAGGLRSQPADSSRRILTPGSAALVLDILADPLARIPGFGAATPLELPFPAAAKTGTSRDFTDNWAVAVTGGFTVAVWVGNFDGRPMEGVSGMAGAGPLLHRAALRVAARHHPGLLPRPEQLGARPVAICRLSGQRASTYCAQETEWFLPGTDPGAPCDWHRSDGSVTLPAQFALWASTPAPAAVRGTGTNPRRLASADTASRFRIASPVEGDRFRFVPGVDPRYATIALRVAGAPAAVRVRWTLDGRPLAGGRWTLVPGRHVLRAEAGALTDEVRFSVEAPR